MPKVIQPREEFHDELKKAQAAKAAKTPIAAAPVAAPKPSYVSPPPLKPLAELDYEPEAEQPSLKVYISLIVLAALNIIGGLNLLANSPELSAQIGGVVQIVLGTGLLIRQDTVRKILIVLSALSIVTIVGIAVTLSVLWQTASSKADSAMLSLEKQAITAAPAQKIKIQETIRIINDEKAKTEAVFNQTYAMIGFQIIFNLLIIFYLRWHKVKIIFQNHTWEFA